MRLSQLAERMADEESFELTPEQSQGLDVQTEVALLARRCGVQPSIADLKHPVDREAWRRAGDRYQVEIAQRIGLASQGEFGIALAQADQDDGQAASYAFCRSKASTVAAEIKQARSIQQSASEGLRGAHRG